MTTLTEFLRDRYDEDGRDARQRIQAGEGRGTPAVKPSPAHVLADVVDAGVAAGLPEPYVIFAADYTTSHIGISGPECFADVAAWANWLGVEVVTHFNEERTAEFCEATAERDGVTFQVATNRRVEQHQAHYNLPGNMHPGSRNDCRVCPKDES